MITSRENESIKQIVKLMTSPRERRERECFAAEGVRLCRDAVDSEADILEFVYTAEAAEKYHADYIRICQAAKKMTEVSLALFKKISDTNTPQGFLCIIGMNKDRVHFNVEKGKKYAALENIQDPSNMGTILRTAEAFGAEGILLSPDCCDVYSPKVIRGSMGAVFRLPMMVLEEFTKAVGSYTAEGIPTYASTPRNAVELDKADFSNGGVMLIGNEGNGLREETIRNCSERIMIRMRGRAESLNASAAAAVLLYEMMK